ncbi:hypothetical protein ACJVQT_22950 [Enterobacter huaxiensis]|uniref:hypothetical protein n=1 Tax=Enterobacter huaxiensis TaxID=2494702 RepID=UPI0021756D94|nr:hypothetical protein [Enterobacter huaxiensis]MCS5452526.1 hypothetical protein [Enterobacter huaxiensis]
MSLESELKKTNTLLTQLLERLPAQVGESSGQIGNASISEAKTATDGGKTSDQSVDKTETSAEIANVTATHEEEAAEAGIDFEALRASLTKAVTGKAAAHTEQIRAILAKYDASRVPEVADHDLRAVEAEIAEL